MFYKRLLKAGANIYAADHSDDTASVLAIRLDDPIILSVLHSHANHLLEHDLVNNNYPLERVVTFRALKKFGIHHQFGIIGAIFFNPAGGPLPYFASHQIE